MKKPEILAKLIEWQTHQIELDAQLDRLYDLVGCQPDSPFFDAIYRVAEAHTAAVSQIIGDEDGWLSWWQFENDYGNKQMSAAPPGGKLRPIKTLKQLAGLIGG